jgi:hypothetical protein
MTIAEEFKTRYEGGSPDEQNNVLKEASETCSLADNNGYGEPGYFAFNDGSAWEVLTGEIGVLKPGAQSWKLQGHISSVDVRDGNIVQRHDQILPESEKADEVPMEDIHKKLL